jgi:hypothetical protein
LNFVFALSTEAPARPLLAAQVSAIEELQTDLDGWLADYNGQRPHQGGWCFGKTKSRCQTGWPPCWAMHAIFVRSSDP